MANGMTTTAQPGISAELPQVNVTTPLGFFSNTIKPTFNQDIFSEDNLSEEVQKPDLTSPLVLRDNVMKAAGDEDLSLTEFDAAANLARQTLLSDLSSQDIYTRSKRDLQFNIGAERDIQFQQGRQLLSDIDAFIESQRATVVQREYEKELKRQEELLKEEKKEQLQLMAMQMGIDPDGMSRKELRSAIAGKSAEVEAYSRSRSGGSGGKTKEEYQSQIKKTLLGQASNWVNDRIEAFRATNPEVLEDYKEGTGATTYAEVQDAFARAGLYDSQLSDEAVANILNQASAAEISSTDMLYSLEQSGYIEPGEYDY